MRFLKIAFLTVSIISVKAQDVEVNVNHHYGFIADVSNEYGNLINRYVWPLELSVSKPSGTRAACRFLNGLTRYGLSLYYVNLGNENELGHLTSLKAFLKTRVYGARRFSLFVKSSLGWGYLSKIYQPLENPRNKLFSKHENIVFGIEGLVSCTLAEHINLNGGIVFNHFSNGQTKLPNKGMNVASAKMGFDFQMCNKQQPIARGKMLIAQNDGVLYCCQPMAGEKIMQCLTKNFKQLL
ncbi:MAG: acyloxyacyl hydrolase [Bacteroidales bacterium]|nr:acyloxyacyl hydrolase [Bacteroidales bacterium]